MKSSMFDHLFLLTLYRNVQGEDLSNAVIGPRPPNQTRQERGNSEVDEEGYPRRFGKEWDQYQGYDEEWKKKHPRKEKSKLTKAGKPRVSRKPEPKPKKKRIESVPRIPIWTHNKQIKGRKTDELSTRRNYPIMHLGDTPTIEDILCKTFRDLVGISKEVRHGLYTCWEVEEVKKGGHYQDKISVSRAHKSAYFVVGFPRAVYGEYGMPLHQFVWLYANPGGKLRGKDISHMCNNTRCIRPYHLELAIHKEQMTRKQCFGSVSFGRNHNWTGCKHSSICRRSVVLSAKDEVFLVDGRSSGKLMACFAEDYDEDVETTDSSTTDYEASNHESTSEEEQDRMNEEEQDRMNEEEQDSMSEEEQDRINEWNLFGPHL